MIAIELMIAGFFLAQLYQKKSIKELPKFKLVTTIFVVTLIIVKLCIKKNLLLGIIILQILFLAVKIL